MVYAIQKFEEYRVNVIESTSSLIYILCGQAFYFSYGKVGHKFTFLLWVNSPVIFGFVPILWWCGGFCSCLVIHFLYN